MFMNKIRLHLGTQLKKAEVSGLRESLKEQSTMIAILKRRVEGGWQVTGVELLAMRAGYVLLLGVDFVFHCVLIRLLIHTFELSSLVGELDRFSHCFCLQYVFFTSEHGHALKGPNALKAPSAPTTSTISSTTVSSMVNSNLEVNVAKLTSEVRPLEAIPAEWPHACACLFCVQQFEFQHIQFVHAL
jgi:hypothetical protein